MPIAQPHQRVKACGSTKVACMCPHVQACQCSLCIVFAIVYWWYVNVAIIPSQQRGACRRVCAALRSRQYQCKLARRKPLWLSASCQRHQPCLMLYQCWWPLVCNDIADCLLSLGCQRCSNAAWLVRDACAHPCKCAQCMHESQHALTPLPTFLPSSPLLSKEGRTEGGRSRSVCASEVAHSWCQAALCCSWRCLHPFIGRELQLLHLVKALCAACPACSPQQHV